MEGWKVERDTVIRVTVSATPIPVADMKAELEHLPWDEDHGWLYYVNREAGIVYQVWDGKVTSITYEPNEEDWKKFACKNAARG